MAPALLLCDFAVSAPHHLSVRLWLTDLMVAEVTAALGDFNICKEVSPIHSGSVNVTYATRVHKDGQGNGINGLWKPIKVELGGGRRQGQLLEWTPG